MGALVHISAVDQKKELVVSVADDSAKAENIGLPVMAQPFEVWDVNVEKLI